MTPGYYNLLSASCRLFVEHELLYYNQAYTNYSGQLYSTTDPNFSQYNIWGSAFRQWGVDASVTGMNQPSGVYQNNVFVSRGASGLAIDYERGRVLGNNLNNPTASFAVKNFNCYFTNLDEAEILIENSFQIQPQINQVTGALFWNQQPVPCIYFKLQGGTNVPFALGGLDQSQNTINLIVIADNPYSLDACCSALNDTARKYFPLIPADQLPFNVFGDVKSGIYNYNILAAGQNPTNFVLVDKVKTSKFTESVNKQINKQVWVALVDMYLVSVRNPRRY